MGLRIREQFAAQVVGLFILGKYRAEVNRPFKMRFHPVPAVLAQAGWLYVFFHSGSAQPRARKFMLYAFRAIATGLGVCCVLAWKKGAWPFRTLCDPPRK